MSKTLKEMEKELGVVDPLQHQVDGDHYKKMEIQPWEIIEANKLDFWEGNVLKYLLRYKEKNGVRDLKKAKHYIDYLIERIEKW